MKYLPFIISLFIGYSSFGQRGGQLRQNIKDPIFSGTRDQTNDPLARPIYPVRETDVFWTKEVLRVIDLSDKQNNKLLHVNAPSDSNLTITSMLIHALMRDEIFAYTDIHDIATMETKDAIHMLNNDSASIDQYLLLESWRFDPSIKRMVVVILGIAPGRRKNSDTACEQILWFKYDPLRTLFANYYVGELGITIDDFFELRNFRSKIIKTTVVDSTYNSHFPHHN